jgi:hypothetical protein
LLCVAGGRAWSNRDRKPQRHQKEPANYSLVTCGGERPHLLNLSFVSALI